MRIVVILLVVGMKLNYLRYCGVFSAVDALLLLVIIVFVLLLGN